MSKFETVSSITKLVIAGFMFHLSMSRTVAGGGSNGGQQFDWKVKLFFDLLSWKKQPKKVVFDDNDLSQGLIRLIH